MTPLFIPLANIKGIGTKTGKLLDRLAGTKTIDALWHLPNNVIHRPLLSVNNLKTGEYATVKIHVMSHNPPKNPKGVYKVFAQDDYGTAICINFFKAYASTINKKLPTGADVFVSGRTETFNGQWTITHPDYIAQSAKDIPEYEAVYPLTAGITNKMMRGIVQDCMARCPELPQWGGMTPSFKQALVQAHAPRCATDTTPLSSARQRLAYDELLANQLALLLARRHMRRLPGIPVKGDGGLRAIVKNHLPFKLTPGQSAVLEEIYADQASGNRMIRLLQGDVGSGKTIVALLAAINAIETGKQAAFMCPTDLLARQHYSTIDKFAGQHIRVGLMTSGAKPDSLDRLDLIVGTHALFQQQVRFENLGIAIIDEQHRFGVYQRMRLTAKGLMPDLLLMTATPIPRSLALTTYGDMDISILDHKPSNRLPILTKLIGSEKIAELTYGIKRAVTGGQKVYWVCPLVEDTEKSDITAVKTRFETLNELLPGKVGLVHGKMKPEQRESAMSDFIEGRTCILVCTTVIEVGVDVPSATIMVIEHAQRFGLAQLHQLRGRVGRGNIQSHCILLYSQPLSPIAGQRLMTIRDNTDGFVIAEKDLEMRGAGEMLGARQSGMQDFKIADIFLHRQLLQQASFDAKNILKDDPRLMSKRGQSLRTLLYLFEKDRAVSTISAG